MRAIALVRYTRGPGEVHQGQSDPKVTQRITAGTGAEGRPRLRDSRRGQTCFQLGGGASHTGSWACRLRFVYPAVAMPLACIALVLSKGRAIADFFFGRLEPKWIRSWCCCQQPECSTWLFEWATTIWSRIESVLPFRTYKPSHRTY